MINQWAQDDLGEVGKAGVFPAADAVLDAGVWALA
jgi:hypothetical protein